MSITSPRRALGLLLSAALIVTMAAVPAVAKPLAGTASIEAIGSFDTGEVYAGTPQQGFEVTVTNPLGVGASSVDWIEVMPTSDFTIVEASGPGDWEADVRLDGSRVVFTGDSLLPGASATFDVVTNVGRPEFDAGFRWSVQASDDGGQTAVGYKPASDGAMSPIIRVLRVTANQFTGPTEALDGDATAGQTLEGETTVENLGSATIDGSVQLTAESLNLTATSIPVTIGAWGTETGTVVVGWQGIAEVGNARVTADASGTDATWGQAVDAPVVNRTSIIEILSAVNLTDVSNTLSPELAVPGTAVSFAVDLENLGQAALSSIDLATSTFEFAGGAFSAQLESPSSLDGGSTARFTFQETTIPTTIVDGLYTPTVRIVGTDHNGVPVDDSFPLSDQIEIDGTIPEVDVQALLPTTAVNGEDDAATSGVTFEVTGEVRDYDPVSDSYVPCGDCAVDGILSAYKTVDGSGEPLQTFDVAFTNDNGELSAEVNVTFPTGTRSAQVEAAPSDAAGQDGATGSTAVFDVDIEIPNQNGGITGGPDGQDFRRIDIALTERVAFPDRLTPQHFDVEGNLVTSVSVEDSTGIDNNDAGQQGNEFRVGDSIVLELASDLGEDETPVVRFRGVDLDDRPYDRVELELPNFEIEVADGILPPLPAFDAVGGLDELEGQFFINDSAPEVVVSNVTEGHKIRIYVDDGNGVLDSADRQVGEKEVLTSGTTTVQIGDSNGDGEVDETDDFGDLGASDGDVTVLTQATDKSGNPGDVALDTVTLDFTVPVFASFAEDESDGRQVIVTFSEKLRDGRNHVSDWVIEVERFGRYVALNRDQVSGDDNTVARTVHIEEDDPNWQYGVARVTYDFTGEEVDRYIDRAGNVLANFQHSTS